VRVTVEPFALKNWEWYPATPGAMQMNLKTNKLRKKGFVS